MAGRKKAVIEQSKIVTALEFLNMTFKAGDDQSMYCMLANQTACAFNMVIALGTFIDEDLTACPNTDLMLTALLRCGPQYQVMQLSESKLLVRSDDFQAYIPCLKSETLSWPIPDAKIATIDDRLLEAIHKVSGLASTKGESVLECSVQVNAGTVLASNRRVIMQAYHGIDLPDGLVFPKSACNVLHKAKKHATGFGYSANTVTIYFEDNSWMRTQLFQDKWPDVCRHFNIAANPRPVPPDLFEAAKKVAPFSADGRVYVQDGFVSSHPSSTNNEGGELRLPVDALAHSDRIYDAKNMALIAKHVVTWDENAKQDGTLFFGENLRGLIYHEHFSSTGSQPTDDEDIPF